MWLNNLYEIEEDRLISIKIEGSQIAAISHEDSGGKGLIFKDAMVFPGLINSHDHLDFNLFPRLGNHIYRNYVEWGDDIHVRNKGIIDKVLAIPRALRTQWGLYKNLLNGVTTVINHGPRLEIMEELITVHQQSRVLHSVQLEKNWKLKLNRPFIAGKPVVIHIGEGTDKKARAEIDTLHCWNLWHRPVIGIHGVAMTARQAANFKALIWCPDSNYFLLDASADIKQIKEKTRILFGTDSTVSAGWDIWEQIRLARKLGQVSDAELYHLLNRDAAEIWGLKNTGQLLPGMDADLVIARKTNGLNNFNAFYCNKPENILLLLHKGHVRYFDESLLEQMQENSVPIHDFCKINFNGQMKYIAGNMLVLIKEIRKYCKDAIFPFTLQ